MAGTWDVVAGAGHNSLVATAYLARAGLRCLVLDRVRQAFGAYRYTPIGYGPGLADRLAVLPEGARWRRTVHRSAWELVTETFTDPRSRAFMLFLAFMTMQPVDRAGAAPLAYSLPFGRQRHSWVLSWQAGAAMFVTHYATTQPPRFATDDGTVTPVAAGIPTSVERILETDRRPGAPAPPRAEPGRRHAAGVGRRPYADPAGAAGGCSWR